MSLVTFAKTSLALLYAGFFVLLLTPSMPYNAIVALAWLAWNVYTFRHTGEVIEAYVSLGQLLPWYVVVIPVALFDLMLAMTLARMDGVATRELPGGHVDAMSHPVTPTSNVETLSASPIEAIMLLVLATVAVKLALPKLAAYDKEKGK